MSAPHFGHVTHAAKDILTEDFSVYVCVRLAWIYIPRNGIAGFYGNDVQPIKESSSFSQRLPYFALLVALCESSNFSTSLLNLILLFI